MAALSMPKQWGICRGNAVRVMEVGIWGRQYSGSATMQLCNYATMQQCSELTLSEGHSTKLWEWAKCLWAAYIEAGTGGMRWDRIWEYVTEYENMRQNMIQNVRQNMRQNIEAGAGGMTWDRIWNCCHFKSFQSYRRLGPTISWSTSRSFLSTVYNTSPTNFKLENQLWRVCLFVWPSSFFSTQNFKASKSVTCNIWTSARECLKFIEIAEELNKERSRWRNLFPIVESSV